MHLASLLLPLMFAPPEGGEGLEAAQAIFDESCTLCHDAGDDKINLEDASALVGVPSPTTGMPFVDPGKPNNSYLYLKMIAAENIEGESMPLGDDPLPADQLTAVRDWIAALPAAEEGGSGEGSGGGGETEGGGGESEGGGGESGGGMAAPEDPPPVKRKPRSRLTGRQEHGLDRHIEVPGLVRMQ